MKKLYFVGLILLLTTKLCLAITIAENSIAKMQIVLSDNPSLVEKTSSKELKEHLDLICKSNFEIVTNSKRDISKRAIFVGDFNETKSIFNCKDFTALDYDSIKIKTTNDGNIALCGHPKRGTLYAVYTFLEDYIGVRWWSDSERYIPNKPTIKIEAINITYAPKFMLREALYRIAFNGVFASRMKQNGATLTKMNFNRPVISEEYGGCENLVLFKGRGSSFHSHYEIIPPEKYFKNHPDWFSLVNGKRTSTLAQLCLTNEEMTQEYIKNVKKILRENPKATSIQVSQNDWRNPCECTECKAIDGENKSHAGTNIYFANKIGEAIEKEFPHVFIDTFAYQYTRKAPTKIRPRKNVLVRLCTIECSFAKPLEDATEAKNKAFVDDIKDWAKLTKNLFIWDYVTCFRSYMIPHPNMRALAPNIRFFAKNSVAGIFEQGDDFCNAGDFVLLRNWVISHLMWNPQLDEHKLFDEFLYGYYGQEVGKIFKEYIDVIHNCAEEKNMFTGCFSDNMRWIDTQTYNKASALIEKANEVAVRLEKEKPQSYAGLVKKVRRESLSFQHMSIVYYKQLKLDALKEGLEINLPKNPKKLVEHLISTWNELNVETWREFTTLEEFKAYQQHLLNDIEQQLKLSSLPFKQSLKSDMNFDSRDFIMLDISKKYFGCTNTIKDVNSISGYAIILPEAEERKIIRAFVVPQKLGIKKSEIFEFFARIKIDSTDIEHAKNNGVMSTKLTTSDWKIKAKKNIKIHDINNANNYCTVKLFDVKINENDEILLLDIRKIPAITGRKIYIDKIYAQKKSSNN